VTYDIRELTEEKQLTKALEVFLTSLVGIPVPESEAGILDFVEAGRPLGAFLPGSDGEPELVGTVGSFTSGLIVPGGARVPMAGVTDVGVLPTHTRRGLASALLRRQLQQIAERGEIVASLRATEATIYERFGYGIASATAAVEVDVARARIRPTVPVDVAGPADRSGSTDRPGSTDRSGGEAESDRAIRFVDPRTSWELLAGIYAKDSVVGRVERPKLWWNGHQSAASRNKSPLYAVVHGPAGAEDGYLRYHPTSTGPWLDSSDRTIVIDDLVAHNRQAYLDFLRFLFSIDLVQRIVFGKLPVDHSLEKLVLNERAVRTTGINDETWLRLIDVQAALSARTYRGSETVTIAVIDELLPANTGSYRIRGSEVERTDAAPDLSLDVAALASVYLGGTRWWQLGDAGRVVEHRAGALAAADQLFGTDRQPFAGTMF
jgi:predicted acetyltransferase